MNTDLKDFINECSACQSQPDQCCETKQLYPVPSCPWSIILSADLFTLGQQFFNLVDYWSGFFEVQKVRVYVSEIIAAYKVQPAGYSIPKVSITNNGTQFTSSAFSGFVKECQFE